MKYRVSITVDEETLRQVKAAVRKGTFRNRSHAFEYAAREVIRDDA